MKEIEWIIRIENDQIMTMEHLNGLNSDNVEDTLLIVGILENLKNKELEKLKTLYKKSKKV
ncbi:MAG: hypothetical protein QXO70_01895 [Candidatus Pacearchaeota archaeon]